LSRVEHGVFIHVLAGCIQLTGLSFVDCIFGVEVIDLGELENLRALQMLGSNKEVRLPFTLMTDGMQAAAGIMSPITATQGLPSKDSHAFFEFAGRVARM
jgi:hypothetical protein